MKRILRILALLTVLGAVGFWLAAGANRGWTKNKVAKTSFDPVANIMGTTYEKTFIPGVDFLGEAFLVSLFLTGCSFLFRNQNKAKPSN